MDERDQDEARGDEQIPGTNFGDRDDAPGMALTGIDPGGGEGAESLRHPDEHHDQKSALRMSGIRRAITSGVKITQVRPQMRIEKANRPQRMSGT